MTTENKTHAGRCFCGTVEIAVNGEPVGMGFCHCQSCRTWSAAPVNAFTLWPQEAVRVTKVLTRSAATARPTTAFASGARSAADT